MCELFGIEPDTLRIRFTKLHRAGHADFPERWRIDGELTEKQVRELLSAGERKGSEPKVAQAQAQAKEIETDTAPPAVIAMIDDAGRPNEVAPNVGQTRRWPLWVCLAITAGASIPNMAEVTMAMKGSSVVSWAITAAFTVVPFLLIMARVKGVFAWVVVVGVMGYTAFCNTSAIFGGLTALDKGYILKPTVFLEAVTNLLNTDYLNTARTLSALMALLIGAIEFTAFKNLASR